MIKTERKVIHDYTSVETTGCITFEKLTQKYNKKLEEIHAKYENVHDVVVTCVSSDYNDGEDHIEELEIRFKRNETSEEYQRRIAWQEFLAQRHNQEQGLNK